MDYDQDQIDDDVVEQDNDVGCDDFYMMWRWCGWWWWWKIDVLMWIIVNYDGIL